MGQPIAHRRGSVVGALLLCALAGCAAPSRVQPSPVAPPVVGRETVNATLWMQRAAEYRISAEQVYGLAAERLTTTIAAPGTAAVEQQGADVATLARLPTAVIVDLDETVLDNSFYQARRALAGAEFDDGRLMPTAVKLTGCDAHWLSVLLLAMTLIT